MTEQFAIDVAQHAFLIALQNVYASTLVASLFLARIGAQGMPFYYVLFALVSIPFAALFSSIIDRFPRPAEVAEHRPHQLRLWRRNRGVGITHLRP